MIFDEKTRRLSPSSGMFLTQANLQDESKRNFHEFAYIARGGSIYIFTECTEAEKLAWEEAHKPEEPIEIEQ